MGQIYYNVSGSNGNANISIKKSGDNSERCSVNCSGIGNGSKTSDFINSDLYKGISHTINILISEGDCSSNESRVICCPATGGIISGSNSPSSNTNQNYIISGIDGLYSKVESNNGFSISGGNAYFNSTTSEGVANINVGNQPFTLCYNILSCNEPRSICISINPQTTSCIITVGSISITC